MAVLPCRAAFKKASTAKINTTDHRIIQYFISIYLHLLAKINILKKNKIDRIKSIAQRVESMLGYKHKSATNLLDFLDLMIIKKGIG